MVRILDEITNVKMTSETEVIAGENMVFDEIKIIEDDSDFEYKLF